MGAATARLLADRGAAVTLVGRRTDKFADSDLVGAEKAMNVNSVVPPPR